MSGYYKEGSHGIGSWFVMCFAEDGTPGQCCSVDNIREHTANVNALRGMGYAELTREVADRLAAEKYRRWVEGARHLRGANA